MREIKISDHIWFVGENDRRKELFENNWPLPYGVSYNTYVINDVKTALIDTIEFGVAANYIAKIRRILNGKGLDYMVINHLEPDHASMIDTVFAAFPQVKVVGNMQTFKILQHYYHIPQENRLQVKDGDEIDLGDTKLQFFTAPWVHWPETMVTYDQTTKTLFSCDAFGGFGTLDGGIYDTNANFEEHYLAEMRRYYSNIVAKYSNMVQKALA
ncbi:MAG: MBL fold metallo-hydrolase [Bacteroidales bacterium]|nr:MBL fold metallo-hydrolase [Bacteroidales bacterium]